MATKRIITRIRNDDNPSYVDKLLFIRQFDVIKLAKNRVNFKSGEKSLLTRRFNALKKSVTPSVQFVPLGARQLAALKDKKFNTTGKGIFVATPKDGKTGKKLVGVRTRVNLNGTIVISKGGRVDYIVPLSKKQITRLITDKPNINNVVVRSVFDDNPGLAKKFRAAKPAQRHLRILFKTHRSNQRFANIASLQNYLDAMNDKGRDEINALVFIILKPPARTKKNGKKNGKKKKAKKN